jgi:Subtilisin inhibitor-like
VAGLLAAGALTGTLGVVPAAQAAAPAPASQLQLTVTPHGRDASTLVRTVTWACQPGRGKHPQAAAACAALDTAEGRLDRLPGAPGMAA